jgi:hypothetical protein
MFQFQPALYQPQPAMIATFYRHVAAAPGVPQEAGGVQRNRRRNRFTEEEDAQFVQLVVQFPTHSWAELAKMMPGRIPRQIRDRYQHYMSPGLNLSAWTPEEDAQLREKFEVYGPQWSILKSFFANRSAINVKNHWTTLISQDCRQAWESRSSAPSGTTATPVPAEFLADEVPQIQEIEQIDHNGEQQRELEGTFEVPGIATPPPKNERSTEPLTRTETEEGIVQKKENMADFDLFSFADHSIFDTVSTEPFNFFAF